MITMSQIFQTAVRENASDVHIVSGIPPSLRIDGNIQHLNVATLTSQQTKELCYSLITDEQKTEFEHKKDLDFSLWFNNNKVRFRGHLSYQRRSVSGVFRQIATKIPKPQDIGLPELILNLSKKPHGLILVTGPTGSGKSTTLATMIDHINKTKQSHIITMEDPIEFVYTHEKSIVSQREIGLDAESFQSVLRATLRMDPDVCLLGELRDRETIEIAAHVAETGHLTFGTLHTNNSYQSLDRLIGSFPGDQQVRMQNQLALCLEAIISQKLIPVANGKGRVPALEILLFTPAVRNLVKEGKLMQIYNAMQTSRSIGMCTLNHSLASLYQQGIITQEMAINSSYNQDELDSLLSRLKVKKKWA